MERDFCIDGRHFRTKDEYEVALKEKKRIEELREKLSDGDVKKAKLILEYIRSGKLKFTTILGRDFVEELEDLCDDIPGYDRILKEHSRELGKGERPTPLKQTNREQGVSKTQNAKKEAKKEDTVVQETKEKLDTGMEEAVRRELKKLELRRKWLRLAVSLVAVVSFLAFGIYQFYENRTQTTYDKYEKLKDQTIPGALAPQNNQVVVHKTEAPEQKEVLEEYKNLLNINKKLIGWLKIDDTNINYPVVQTTDNEYYLSHNLEQEYDKNGSIFMDMDCDVLKPSTNYILYGHRMQSGAMFGKLSKYEDSKYCKEHEYIEFDTIYEKGIYQVMYVFRSTILNSDDVSFKYYQFIEANSEQEFDSNMEQMAAISLVDTGVSASYGDHLLTLSTCDYYETNGRFVVVAKKVPAKE